MKYLTNADEIKQQIDQLTSYSILWLDTEIADWHTKRPRLSLIQASCDDENNHHNVNTYILDVLDKLDLVDYFIRQIMINTYIKKVFHNANFDLKYLGKDTTQNVTCTFKIAQKIGKKTLGVSNLKLKTLAVELCGFTDVDTEEGVSDWGKRPLSTKQLQYAAMDTVYLAVLYRRLQKLVGEAGEKYSQSSSYFKSNTVSTCTKSSDNLNMKNSSESDELDKLSPTKVRIAFECPKLFYLYHHFGGKSLFVPEVNNYKFPIGYVFHELANGFINLALSEPKFINIFIADASQLNPEEVATAMQQLFYQRLFFPMLQQHIIKDENSAKPLLEIWQGLQRLIRRFAEILILNRHYCQPQNLIQNTFIQENDKLTYNFALPNGKKQPVTGEYDCLVFNFRLKRLCVIEFKTYSSVDPAAQLAQVALYSYMLAQQKSAKVDAAVYCVLPEFKEYQYTWEELESTVHKIIPNKLQQMQSWLSWKSGNINPPPKTAQLDLCNICPQQEKCQTFFGESETSPSTGKEEEKNNTSKQNEQNHQNQQAEVTNQIGEDVVRTLGSFGIPVDLMGVTLAPSFIRVKVKPLAGIKFNKIQGLAADLQVQLGLVNQPMIAPQAGYVSVDLPRKNRQVVKFEDYIQAKLLPANSPVKIALGIDLEGRLIEAELSDPNTCHFLVGGTTGSGKSEFLRSLLLSLIMRHSPENLQIALVDPKRVTFPEFEQMKWLYTPIVKDSDDAIALMENLVTEMEKRYQLFEQAQYNDLNSYNNLSSRTLPRIVCIFDEYADLMADKELRKDLENSIKRLGAKARAAGIHLIIATQRPEATVVTPLIRSNLPGRVALKTASEADSTIILGAKEVKAAYLLGKGDLLYQVASHRYRLQSLFTAQVKV